MDIKELLGQEWIALQNSHEQYETDGLHIKLVGFTLAAVGVALGLNTAPVIALLLVIWVQEGIYRTFQARIGQRILRVEELIAQPGATGELFSRAANANMPFQLHSEWLAGRKGVLGLVTEYAANACKPTVAYPYAVLIVVLIANCWLG